MNFIMGHIKYCLIFLFVLAACTNDAEIPVTGADDVNVMIEIPVSGTTKAAQEQNVSVLVFRENENSGSEFFRREKSDWNQEGESLNKTLILPSGKYRFLLSYGSPFNDKDYDDFQAGTPLNDCLFSLTASNGKLDQGAGELFLDNTAGGEEPWNEIYDCSTNKPQVIERTLTRVVGRVDVLVRRGRKEGDGSIKPVDEGIDSVIAYNNTLSKIKEIEVTVRGTGSKLHLNGFNASDMASFSYVIGKYKTPFYFDYFNAEEFERITSSPKDRYKKFDKFPYCKGPFLFPSVDVNNTELEVKMRYNNFPEKTYIAPVRIERNNISLITLWLLEEQVNIDLDVTVTMAPLMENSLIGDEGIWD